jgi:hypothetical protein
VHVRSSTLPCKQGPLFEFKVTDRGRPVERLRLQLADSDFFDFEHQRTRHSVTDADGFAHFTNVSPDEYFLSADLDGSIGDGATVMVKPNGPSGVTVPLKWPNQEPLSVRSVRGTLSVPNYEPRLPPSHLSLSLLGGLSGRVLETTQSDSTGRFAFGEVPPGIYFLQLNPSGVKDRWTGEEITGLIAIEVSREADEEALDLDVGWSGCGFMYADRTRCSQDTLEVSKVCGYVYDITGAVIPNADIVLQEHIGGWETSKGGPHGHLWALCFTRSERRHVPVGSQGTGILSIAEHGASSGSEHFRRVRTSNHRALGPCRLLQQRGGIRIQVTKNPRPRAITARMGGAELSPVEVVCPLSFNN